MIGNTDGHSHLGAIIINNLLSIYYDLGPITFHEISTLRDHLTLKSKVLLLAHY